MSKIGIFFADSCEEIEGLTVVDLCRRAGIEVEMISINGTKQVTGSHQIIFETNSKKEDVDYTQLDGIVLPGGMPGTNYLQADETVQRVIAEFAKENKLVAAICAAPSVLGMAGLLEGKKATCYPGFEEKLLGATPVTDEVVTDGTIITSRSMGTAVVFGLEIVRYFLGDEASEELGKSIIYRQ